VGEHVAGILAGSFESLEKLIRATLDELVAIDGVGPVVAESIVEFFKKNENRKLVDDMIANGVQIFRDNAHKQGTLAGKIFVLTGTLATLTRSEVKRAVEEAGGKVTGSVSRKTDYLVVGVSPGSKLKRAEELGVDIIDEETLMKLMIEDR
jgi:DNA ligase (NAD+)